MWRLGVQVRIGYSLEFVVWLSFKAMHLFKFNASLSKLPTLTLSMAIMTGIVIFKAFLCKAWAIAQKLLQEHLE